MQRAARKVVEENLRLRSLLANRGVSQSEIDAYLQSFDAGSAQGVSQGHSHGSNHGLPTLQQTEDVVTAPGSAYSVGPLAAQATAFSSSPFAAQQLLQALFQPPVHVQQSFLQPGVSLECNVPHSSEVMHRATRDVRQGSPRTLALDRSMRIGSEEATCCKPAEMEASPYQRTALNAVHDTNTPTFSLLENDAGCPNTASCFCPPSSTPKEQSLDTGLLISCETAASIIAEMRGDGDRNRIRASLGCRGDEECKVKNTLVLELMDER